MSLQYIYYTINVSGKYRLTEIPVGQKSGVRTVSMQSVSIIAWKDLFLEPFLLIFINLQFDTSSCVLIYCKTLSSSIIADTRVTNIWHFLLEEILLFLLVPTTIDCRCFFLFTTVKPSPFLEDFWLPTICDRSMGCRSLRGRCNIPILYQGRIIAYGYI